MSYFAHATKLKEPTVPHHDSPHSRRSFVNPLYTRSIAKIASALDVNVAKFSSTPLQGRQNLDLR